jgi:hypothetical protein
VGVILRSIWRAQRRWIHGFRKHNASGGGVRITALPFPANLYGAVPSGDIHRLTVAVGLSLPFADIPEVLYPPDIDDAPPPRVRPIEERYVGKNQV